METPPLPQRRRRLLVAYNHTELSSLAEVPEPEPEAVRELIALLSAQDFEVVAINAEDNCDRLGDAVVLHRPDLILNLIDHFHGTMLLAGAAASLLDVFEYPYTGGDAHCIGACQDRLISRLMLHSAQVSVPPFRPLWTRDSVPDLEGMRYPLILTQSFDDIYHRADERPLLDDEAATREFAAEVLVDYDPPFLVEEYIGAQKLTVVVVANELALSPVEVWRDEDDEWQVTVADLTEEQTTYIGGVAREASDVMGCRDWAQIEIAVNDDGDVFVTDVRPVIPPWNPDSPFRIAAATHPDGVGGILKRVVDSGLARAARLAAMADAEWAEAEMAEAAASETPEAAGSEMAGAAGSETPEARTSDSGPE